MTPLSTTAESKDECPGTFPSTATPPGTIVAFDLVHATSNKFVDPQYTALNCAGTGTGITNTAYYAFKTGPVGGILSLNVTGYATTPAAQSSCSVAGIELAIYAVSSCPAGQAFPSPFACRTFNANGALANIAGLSANTTYLLLADGIESTKANFSLTFAGGSLPLDITDFSGEALGTYNQLHWKIDFAKDVSALYIEKSANGSEFERIEDITNSIRTKKGSFKDNRPFILDNYYRLVVVNQDGSRDYSKVILLKRNDAFLLNVFPNPAHGFVNVEINSQQPGKYLIKLNNSLGQQLVSRNMTMIGLNHKVSLKVDHLPAGFYQLSVYDEKNRLIKSTNIRIE
jgi:hypothetical protein